ncbi:ribonuclease III [Candidatus Anaplasma sp. TIGMIC]|uniref:ribonuclease III n=1 Tax=Candidatus Anaplasma sp. TIGMIC TaxID=3020713 RepID=UPI00232EBE3B|nr:ribonuclease III [Candidatus Anaplasma sp. TIGMIC]MDB1135735.1 ribonuclease III [Candidatus Anaplasma sp. TIGMIC]
MVEKDVFQSVVDKIQVASGHKFKNLPLLKKALTHPSAAVSKSDCYERLEFLGDAVLGMVVSEMLYRLFPDDNEGFLTKKKVVLVRGSKVMEVARAINLGDAIIMAKGEMLSGGKTNTKNLENAMEAVIGALYIDGGLQAACNFITYYWKPLAEVIPAVPCQDPKTELQEWAQSKNLGIPRYTVVSKSGLEHNPIFTVEASVGNISGVTASGGSKKSAELAAAKLLLEKVKATCTQ